MLKSVVEKILGRTTYSPLEEGIDRGRELDILGEDDNKDDKDDKDDDKDDKDDKSDDKDDKSDDDGDDDKDKDDETEDDDDEDKDDKDEDEDKDDKDDEEEDKDEDQLTSVKDIKKDYPDFFKKHPEVKAAIFRDQRFSEIVGTPEDAETAVERSNTLAAVEQDLFIDSNPGKLLDSLKKNNPENYQKTVFNVLSHLQEHDKDMYYELSALPIKLLLRNAWREGQGDKSNLGKAAAWIHDFMFGKGSKFEDKVTAEEKKQDTKSDREKEYEKKLKDIDDREHNNFKGAVDQSYVSKMDRYLRETLDKDERLTEFTRKHIVNETLTEIRQQLDQDTRHTTTMSSLWRNAKAAGFNSDFKSKIINAALTRAKSLAPSIRARLTNEALGKVKKNKDKNDDKREERRSDSRREERREEPRRESRRESRPSRENKKPLTDMDILRS